MKVFFTQSGGGIDTRAASIECKGNKECAVLQAAESSLGGKRAGKACSGAALEAMRAAARGRKQESGQSIELAYHAKTRRRCTKMPS